MLPSSVSVTLQLSMDRRYQDIASYLIDDSWRKKEIVALTAEKSNISERTVYNWLEDLDEEGFVKMVEISSNRVFVKREKGREFPFDLEIKNETEVHSLIKKTYRLIYLVICKTFPHQLRNDDTSNSVLRSYIRQILSRFQTNAIPPEKLSQLENSVKELNELCRDQFVVVYDEPYVDYIFEILDALILLWENYDDIEHPEDSANSSTLSNDPADMSRMYLSFLSEVSLNATTVGYGNAYNSRLSERLPQLQPLIKTVPTQVADKIYYLIQSHGSVAQRIDGFITRIRSQDGDTYDRFLDDAYLFYDDDERQRLHTQLRNVANELVGQQRTLVERLCIELDPYRSISQSIPKIRYYNETKRKILAVLAHGCEKLGNIARYSGEQKPNTKSNINTLSDDGFVEKVEDQRGYYKLNNGVMELFEDRQNQKPVADRTEVKDALKHIKDWQDEHVYSEEVRIFTEERMLQMVQDSPLLTLVELVYDYAFVLEEREEMDLFFDILDSHLEKIQKIDAHRPSTPDEILPLWELAGLLHIQWKRGLENIRYHSELYNRIDDLKQVHDCVFPSERKNIRNLISIVDFNEADTLFKKAVNDNKESVDDLKRSIRDIYYRNDQVHIVVDFLSSDQNRSPTGRDELQRELRDYAVNLPHEALYIP